MNLKSKDKVNVRILNKSTLDNYDVIKKLVFDKIQDSIENQEKFLEVLFKKVNFDNFSGDS